MTEYERESVQVKVTEYACGRVHVCVFICACPCVNANRGLLIFTRLGR